MAQTQTTEAASSSRAALRRLAWPRFLLLGIGALIGGGLVGLAIAAVSGEQVQPDIGQLSEAVSQLPPTITTAAVRDTTLAWGLPAVPTHDLDLDLDPMAGGLATADLDRDGDLDLVVAHGPVAIYLWETDRYTGPVSVGVDDAMGVSAADVDNDGWQDLLIARSADTDTVLWGGPWLETDDRPERLQLEGTSPSAGLLAGQLNGDTAIDLVRLGRGTSNGAPDVVWLANPDQPRTFIAEPLGADDRLSLAGELVDADLDGLLDIWVTRDVGWDTGPDSLYSRQGDPTGPWVDIAPELGANLAIDGMGITIADLDGDATLDAYVSDLGDNEVLLRRERQFVKATDTGAARIRPLDAPQSVVSSSWASGATDLNLDGRLDLIVANGGFPDGGMRNKIPDTNVAVEDTPAILLGIGGGQFVDIWADLGLDWTTPTRGLTIGDLDNDGDDDYIFLADDGTIRAIRNDATDPSLTIRPGQGCDPAGAVITSTQASGTYQTLLAHHTYAGRHSNAAIVGTNNDDTTTIKVRWANGTTTNLRVPAQPGRHQLTAKC